MVYYSVIQWLNMSSYIDKAKNLHREKQAIAKINSFRSQEDSKNEPPYFYCRETPMVTLLLNFHAYAFLFDAPVEVD